MRSWAAMTAMAAAMVLATPADARDYIVELSYVAPADVRQGEPSFVLGAVTDGREHGPNWLGAIRGGYGNPLKVLLTDGPVSQAVAAAVRDGLGARNLVAGDGARFRLDVHVVQFDCNQYARKEAHIELALRLIDQATDAAAYEHNTRVDRVEGSVLSLRTGIFASTEELRALANAALQEAVDRALDDPGLIAALAQPPAPGPAPAAEVALVEETEGSSGGEQSPAEEP